MVVLSDSMWGDSLLIHSRRDVQIHIRHIHGIHHTHRDQPWPQHQLTSCHSKHNHHRQDSEVHNCHIQVRDIHHREGKDQHQPWARHQQTSCHSNQDVHNHKRDSGDHSWHNQVHDFHHR